MARLSLVFSTGLSRAPVRLALPRWSTTVDRMPEPGDLIAAFSPLPDRCFCMVQSRQLQATHCRGEPAWKGQWQDVKEGWWYVEACRQHAPKVTGWASEGF